MTGFFCYECLQRELVHRALCIRATRFPEKQHTPSLSIHVLLHYFPRFRLHPAARQVSGIASIHPELVVLEEVGVEVSNVRSSLASPCQVRAIKRCKSDYFRISESPSTLTLFSLPTSDIFSLVSSLILFRKRSQSRRRISRRVHNMSLAHRGSI